MGIGLQHEGHNSGNQRTGGGSTSEISSVISEEVSGGNAQCAAIGRSIYQNIGTFFGIPGLGGFTLEGIQAQDFRIVGSMVYLGTSLPIARLMPGR